MAIPFMAYDEGNQQHVPSGKAWYLLQTDTK